MESDLYKRERPPPLSLSRPPSHPFFEYVTNVHRRTRKNTKEKRD